MSRVKHVNIFLSWLSLCWLIISLNAQAEQNKAALLADALSAAPPTLHDTVTVLDW